MRDIIFRASIKGFVGRGFLLLAYISKWSCSLWIALSNIWYLIFSMLKLAGIWYTVSSHIFATCYYTARGYVEMLVYRSFKRKCTFRSILDVQIYHRLFINIFLLGPWVDRYLATYVLFFAFGANCAFLGLLIRSLIEYCTVFHKTRFFVRI